MTDGKTAFTGGTNIRQGNVLARKPKHPVQDLHFRLQGPVVQQLQEAFANDWAFTTGETLQMGQVIQNKLRGAREVTLAEVEGRSYPAKLRDSIARLFSPYL